MNAERILDISWATIFKLALGALTVYFVFMTREILIWIVFGVVISILFNPWIDRLQRLRVPRVVGAVFVYFLVFGLVGGILYGTLPVFLEELNRFGGMHQEYLQALTPVMHSLGMESLAGDLGEISDNILTALLAVFGGIFAVMFIFTVAIFISVDERAMERAIALLFPRRYESIALDVWNRSQRKVSGWFLTRIISSLFVGAATYVALYLFDVQYPLSLSMLAFITNFVPIVGPLLMGALTATLIFFDSQLKALFVILAFVLIQQIESNVLTPLLSNRFIGMPPVLVLIALVMGAQLWGVMGAILAIPLFGIVYEFMRDFLKKKKEETPVTFPE